MSGVLHLHNGDTDCVTAEIADAVATLSLPAEATFGPEGSTVSFDAGSSGTLLIIGQSSDEIPQEARPRIIPLLNWE